MSRLQLSATKTDKRQLAQIQSRGKRKDKQTVLPAALALTPFSTWSITFKNGVFVITEKLSFCAYGFTRRCKQIFIGAIVNMHIVKYVYPRPIEELSQRKHVHKYVHWSAVCTKHLLVFSFHFRRLSLFYRQLGARLVLPDALAHHRPLVGQPRVHDGQLVHA